MDERQSSEPQPVKPTKVIITDFNMPFTSVMMFMIKMAFAAIPAAFVIALAYAAIIAVFAGLGSPHH
jgi:hypothetical protein